MLKAKVFLIIALLFTIITKEMCSGGLIRICYFNAQARYRDSNVRFDTYDIDFSLCTHYVYAYAKIIPNSNNIVAMDPPLETPPTGGAYKNFTGSQRNSRINVTLLLSIGGPNATEHNALAQLTQSEAKMRAFSSNVLNYLWQNFFDGLDIDWQYPNTDVMRSGFVKLLEILRDTLDQNIYGLNYLITVKCPGVYSNIAWDVPGISKYADYIIVAAYNLPSPNQKQAWFGSPLFSKRFSVHTLYKEWQKAGLPARKAVLGITPVGDYFRLESESAFRPGSPIRDEELKGKYFNIPNGLAYSEICEMFKNGSKYCDKATEMNYMVSKDAWVGYEDKLSIEAKVYWITILDLAGLMVSAIDMDDFTGTKCNRGRFPLLHIVKQTTDEADANKRRIRDRSSLPSKTHTKKFSHFVIIILMFCFHI